MPPDMALCLNLISSNYPCLEHICMVPKVFGPLKSTVFSFVYLPNRGQLLKERIWLLLKHIVSLRSRPIMERLCHPGQQTGNYKRSFLYKMAEIVYNAKRIMA